MDARAAVWQHKTSKSDSHWHDFQADISANVEELYQAKSASAKFVVEGRPYTIRFADMKQYSDTDATRVRLVRRVEAPASHKRPVPVDEHPKAGEAVATTSSGTPAASSHEEGPEAKVRRVEATSPTMPTVTVYTLGGNAVWGPQKVTPSMTVADIALAVDRPVHSPGLKLFHGETLLREGSILSALGDPTDLRVQFDPPKLFDHSFVRALCKVGDDAADESYIVGDVLQPDALVIPHAEVVRVQIQELKTEMIHWNVRLRLKAASPLIASKTDKVLQFSEELRHVKTNDGKGTLHEEGHSAVSGQIVEHVGEDLVAETSFTMRFDEDDIEDSNFKVLEGAVDQIYSQHLAKVIHEGVSYRTGSLSKEMTLKLNKSIDVLKAATAADYHPGSNSIVRDLVHPSLFPFVKGTSPTGDLADVTSVSAKKTDKWGRPYETSNYQWLPSEVSVSADGKCTFDTYINNLDREKHSALYSSLEELLRLALPHLDNSWAHGNAVAPADGDSDMDESDASEGDPATLDEKSLRGRTIQVITKIVDYEVPPHGTHEGVWHVEGMSHENIIATAELILSKDDALSGGDLQFQRSFTSAEGGSLIMGLPQCRPYTIDKMVERGVVPLGHLPLPCGRLASWPNSHIHRVTPLKNDSDKTAVRRIVVFWLINPDVRIVSTKHVAPQQSKMTLEEAHRHRLALMEERKRHKQNWNLREVTLCEH
mmetsp:Transcript_110502/g.195613  ORF Transcript_110502/g.195613 Transcript_110502/m.195613 type:complete len:710 (-) Transcript_110502:48-2177(-)